MGRAKALGIALGHFLIYGLSLKFATGAVSVAAKIELPNYDWFILVLVAFFVSIMAFFQESDKKWSKAFGGFLKYLFLAVYTYEILIMSSYIKINTEGQVLVATINWGLWLYVILAPTLLNAFIHLLKPFVEKE